MSYFEVYSQFQAHLLHDYAIVNVCAVTMVLHRTYRNTLEHDERNIWCYRAVSRTEQPLDFILLAIVPVSPGNVVL